MDPALDPRHQQRIERVEAFFAWSFFDEPNPKDAQFRSIVPALDKMEEIDAWIMRFAPKRSLPDFHKLDLAILRQALYEILYTDTPAKVVINEAIEIAKLYAGEEAPRFINGVLGNVVDELRKETHES